ncbi:MAG: energy transducer TonB [Bacteroidales bacterium]|jgi:protein TonB|nr:energy transducer TonB [Bacteroidales bacterium]
MNKKTFTRRANIKALIMLPVLIVICMISSPSVNAQSTEKKDTLKPDSSKIEEDPIYIVAEQMPRFRNQGLYHFQNWVMNNLRYPRKAIKDGTQGMVIARFIIGKDGKVSDVEIHSGISPECDNEVMRVIKKSPRWKPGKQRGKKVRVRHTVPIKFILK